MPRNNARGVPAVLAGVLVALTTRAASAEGPVVFISAFAPGDQGGIHAHELDAARGSWKPLHRTTGVENPFFLALSPDAKLLFSIHARSFGGKEPEQVAAFAIDGRSGRLKPLNRQSTRGSASCYLDVDATGRTLLVANYSTGSVAALPVMPDGSLGEAASFHQHTGSSIDPVRQKGPYAHSIVVSPDNRFALAADLGLDQVLIYRLAAASAKLSPHDPAFAKAPPGAGPRHLAFHPDGKRLYVINELKNSITVFDYDAASGTLAERQTISTLPADFRGTSHCADLKITPDGRFLYGTNRGHDSIAAYSIAGDGKLTLLGIEPSRGKGPQNLAIAGDGTVLLCANMAGNNVVIFRIDTKSGGLKPLGEPLPMPSPSCIRVLR
jgi:6-phosphogluconolactonase